MATDEEREDLRTEPLPPDDEDRLIPTRIARIEAAIKNRSEEITFLQTEISSLVTTRNELIERARQCAITQDNSFKIVEVPIYKKNRVDVAALMRVAPDKYALIKERIKRALFAKYEEGVAKTDTFIAQADVKAEIKDKALLAQIIPVNTEIDHMEASIVPR